MFVLINDVIFSKNNRDFSKKNVCSLVNDLIVLFMFKTPRESQR